MKIEELKKFAEPDPDGPWAKIYAMLEAAQDVAIMVDNCDGKNPPEIERLLNAWAELENHE